VPGDKEAPHSGAATAKSRGAEGLCFVLIIAIALLIERRIPSLSILHPDPIFKNWARTIGELVHVSPDKSGLVAVVRVFALVAPFLIWMNIRTRRDGAHPFDFAQGRLGRALPVYVLLFATYLLTIWQARWDIFLY